MKELINAFAPSGCESQLRELLTKRLKGKFDQIRKDNMGNLIASVGDGGLCVECGMDTQGIMVVSVLENEVRFAPVGKVAVRDILERKVSFENGACGKVFCDEATDDEKAKLSDLYIELESGSVEVGEFGTVDAGFSEDEYGYNGYGLSERIGLAAVCKAVENISEPENLTVLFSAQKRLGARGARGFFGNGNFEKIITVDGCSEDGCVIVAKDEKMVAEPELRRRLEKIAEEAELDVETVVCDENFSMDQVYVSCGDPCAAMGINVICEEGEPDRVSKADFDTAVKFIEEILKRG